MQLISNIMGHFLLHTTICSDFSFCIATGHGIKDFICTFWPLVSFLQPLEEEKREREREQRRSRIRGWCSCKDFPTVCKFKLYSFTYLFIKTDWGWKQCHMITYGYTDYIPVWLFFCFCRRIQECFFSQSYLSWLKGDWTKPQNWKDDDGSFSVLFVVWDELLAKHRLWCWKRSQVSSAGNYSSSCAHLRLRTMGPLLKHNYF